MGRLERCVVGRDIAVMDDDGRKPFWGPNAKPVLIQVAIGAALFLLVKFWLWEPVHELVVKYGF